MIDSYGRKISYLRLSVTDLCNLRCRYCMPEDGVCKMEHTDMLSEDEMVDAVKASASLGIEKVRITGGEPLIKKNILSICERIARVEGIREVCLTTNGLLLPQLAAGLKKAGVSRINLSLDTLDPDKFSYITRRDCLNGTLDGLKAALDAGFRKIKVNTVLMGGVNDDEIGDMAELTRNYPVDVRFIELMPMYDSGDFDRGTYIPASKVLEVLPELKLIEHDGGVAKLFKLPGAQGNIGLINPLSSHFCRSCNRIRITADGMIKPCLHRPSEYSIKGMNEDEMRETIKKAIDLKPEWHGELDSENRSCAGRNMNQIGG